MTSPMTCFACGTSLATANEAIDAGWWPDFWSPRPGDSSGHEGEREIYELICDRCSGSSQFDQEANNPIGLTPKGACDLADRLYAGPWLRRRHNSKKASAS